MQPSNITGLSYSTIIFRYLPQAAPKVLLYQYQFQVMNENKDMDKDSLLLVEYICPRTFQTMEDYLSCSQSTQSTQSTQSAQTTQTCDGNGNSKKEDYLSLSGKECANGNSNSNSISNSDGGDCGRYAPPPELSIEISRQLGR